MFYKGSTFPEISKAHPMEVICQARYPAILSIGAGEPYAFQEKIRKIYPQYLVKNEKPIVAPGAKVPANMPDVKNFHFISADNRWKINLTNSFFALSTGAYTSWGDYAKRFDMPFAHFIKTYEPAWFDRIGLRYVNAFSRRNLGLEGTPWSELLDPVYIGAMASGEVSEKMVLSSQFQTELQLDDSVRARIVAGPGQLHIKGLPSPDPEPKFILDIDLSVAGKISLETAASCLEKLHHQAKRIFFGAMTEKLIDALK